MQVTVRVNTSDCVNKYKSLCELVHNTV